MNFVELPCLRCGVLMKVSLKRKPQKFFCSDTCRVSFNREKKLNSLWYQKFLKENEWYEHNSECVCDQCIEKRIHAISYSLKKENSPWKGKTTFE